MIRPLRNYHRIVWLILALLLPAGFVIAYVLSRKFESFYNNRIPTENSSMIGGKRGSVQVANLQE